jgi:hypothetical protein
MFMSLNLPDFQIAAHKQINFSLNEPGVTVIFSVRMFASARFPLADEQACG